MDEGKEEICSNNDYSSLHAVDKFDGMFDPERLLPSTTPPKRFYRTFWKSLSQRLLHQWARSARPSSKQARAAPMREVD
jgi:hypothetical protein